MKGSKEELFLKSTITYLYSTVQLKMLRIASFKQIL